MKGFFLLIYDFIYALGEKCSLILALTELKIAYCKKII